MTHSVERIQLTVRAAVAGMLLGGFMSLSNLYVALKTGWSIGVSITAGILAFAIFSALLRLGIVRKAFGILENNAMQSVASAAGYMTGGGTVAAIPALIFYNKFSSDVSAFSERMANFAQEVSVRLSRRLNDRREA